MSNASEEARARLEELALKVNPDAYVEAAFERSVEIRIAHERWGSGGLVDICNHPRSVEAAEAALAVLAGEQYAIGPAVDGLFKRLDAALERIESAEDALRSLASYVGNGGYNAPDPIDIDQFHKKIKEGIDSECDLWRKKAETAFGIPRAERAENELAELRGRLAVMAGEWDTACKATFQCANELRAALEAPRG